MTRVPDAHCALIEEHLPLVNQIVLSVAARFPRHVEREELVRAGVLGLVEAASRFEARRGVPFASFAGRRIRGAVLDAVRAADWAPRSVRATMRAAEEAEHSLASTLGRRPTTAEVAEAMDLSVDELDAAAVRARRASVLALDHGVVDDGGETLSLGDVIVDHDAALPADGIEQRELHGYLADAVGLLPERHRTVVVGYFLEGRTSLELAESLGVTESRISQLRSEALLMLREGIEAQYATGEAEPAPVPRSRVAKRKARYAAAITASRTWRERVDTAV